MEKAIVFDISEILRFTNQEYVGRRLSEFASVYVGSFKANLHRYSINAIFDCTTDDKLLVVADEETLTITNKILGA